MPSQTSTGGQLHNGRTHHIMKGGECTRVAGGMGVPR